MLSVNFAGKLFIIFDHLVFDLLRHQLLNWWLCTFHYFLSLKAYFTGTYFSVVPFKSKSGKGDPALNLKMEK